MATSLPLILGAAYFIALVTLGIYTANLWLWLPYFTGCGIFVAVLFIGLNWAVSGEDGHSGFGVVAAHGLVLWTFLIAHAIKWLRMAASFIKNFFSARDKGHSRTGR